MYRRIALTRPGRGAALALMLSLVALIPPHRASAQSSSNMAATNPQESGKSLGERAKERVDGATEKLDELVKRAADIFKRVPCSNKGVYLEGSLPHVAKKLAANQPVTIVAFGSSSTVGFGTTSPIFSYPYRLADQLRRKFPAADITVLNRGIGGEDTPQMMARLKAAVLDAKPDLVIWQLGTNTVIKGDDAEVVRTEALLSDGIDRLKATGADVVLIDPQYVPATTGKDHQEKAGKMVDLLGRVAQAKQIARFPRFAVMRSWHSDQKQPFDTFVIKDGLHLNDWGYACFAQLLGDTIIDTVARVQQGIEVRPDVMMVRPM
ncbi:SGNH/GDSL hydrolase family protein [Bradyrhizobium sp. LHD-71]|uniref:SGNH/GDSL hydrolase family protein n=1 Tax=Bradyrhizobium sp. LHD-71 TaxID=3072141 RepID=UPI00280DC280|nr:SGNH/GDSL hydrolase family protein [Bradyrhizobium sp. LHD-71]MDQ8730324.1 SGNH/GDSL hydrolase family protein [Bradyrhizobium sp. LHD-71]